MTNPTAESGQPAPAQPGSVAKASRATRAAAVILGPALAVDLLAGLSVVVTLVGMLTPWGRGWNTLPRRLAALATLAAVLYAFAVRPWQLSWGAIRGELRRALPGDDLIPNPAWQATRAITIKATPNEIWPWLVQLGQGRGGLYSYDWLENLAGLNIHSVDEIWPEWQRLEAGDVVRLAPGQDALRVAATQPNRALVLGLNVPPAFTWAFVLQPSGDGATRLIVRSRIDVRPRRLVTTAYVLAVEPQHFIMERRMLIGIRERAERGMHFLTLLRQRGHWARPKGPMRREMVG